MVDYSNQHSTQKSRPVQAPSTTIHAIHSTSTGCFRRDPPVSGNQRDLQIHDIGPGRTGEQEIVGGEQKMIRIVSV